MEWKLQLEGEVGPVPELDVENILTMCRLSW